MASPPEAPILFATTEVERELLTKILLWAIIDSDGNHSTADKLVMLGLRDRIREVRTYKVGP